MQIKVLKNEMHPANLTGTFSSSSLGGTFLVQRGAFQLFSKDAREPDTANLVYNFDMVEPSGRKLHFNGYKTVNTGSFLNPFEIWRQTSTLYVTITELGGEEGKVVGRGTLRIQPSDFYQEMQTFQVSGLTRWARLGSAASFFTYFTKQLAIPFFSTLGRLQWPAAPTTDNDTPQASENARIIPIVASDGVKTNMLVWNPLDPTGREAALSETPTILFVPGAAVDHTIFALPTIEVNAITYFRRAGYRCYCVTHRVGRTAIAKDGYTPYDARLDIAAALAQIRKEQVAALPEGPQKIYIVAHCAGSLALSCGLLDGTIPGSWIKGITASMVFMDPKFGKVNQLLSGFPTGLYSKLISPWWDCSSSREDTYVQRAVNQALRLYPVGEARETCRSVVCHRSSLVFGRSVALSSSSSSSSLSFKPA